MSFLMFQDKFTLLHIFTACVANSAYASFSTNSAQFTDCMLLYPTHFLSPVHVMR